MVLVEAGSSVEVHSRMVYSLEERIFILEQYIRSLSYGTTAACFAEAYPEKTPPNKSTIKRLYDKFKTTGSVVDAPRSGRPKVLTEDKVTDISAAMAISPHKSLRRLSGQSGVSYGTAHTAVRKALKMFPYKIRVVQALMDGDLVKRVTYCRWFMEHVTPDGEELDDWYWSDEAWFHLDGYVNSQNSRYWLTDNPHVLHESPLHAQKLGVWCAMSRKRIFILFFETTINSERYLRLVTQFFDSLTDEEKERTWFQQDSATAHTSGVSMDYLESVLPGRVITKSLWPLRSPDLTPPDFFLWGFLKSAAYVTHPHTLDELKTNIQRTVDNISCDTLQRVFRNMIKRVHMCEEVNGDHFQHLL